MPSLQANEEAEAHFLHFNWWSPFVYDPQDGFVHTDTQSPLFVAQKGLFLYASLWREKILIFFFSLFFCETIPGKRFEEPAWAYNTPASTNSNPNCQ